MMKKSGLIGVVLSLGLAGCLSSVLPDPAPADSIYKLSQLTRVVPTAENAAIVRIDRPTAPKVLMGQNVVVSPDGRRMSYAGQAKWAQAIPDLIQSSFFDVLSARSTLVGVLPTSGARTTHRAHLTVRNFEAQFDNGSDSAPLAIVQYTVTVSDAAKRDLLGTHDVRKTVRAGAPSVSSIVEAQDQANSQALTEITDWMENLVQKKSAS